MTNLLLVIGIILLVLCSPLDIEAAGNQKISWNG
jgi:hypothetical protein